jgi:hypothetical protein
MKFDDLDPKWRELDESGKTDFDMPLLNLDDAIFLCALRTLQEARKEDLAAYWTVYRKYWRERLCDEAYFYLKVICARLATADTNPPGSGAACNTSEKPEGPSPSRQTTLMDALSCLNANGSEGPEGVNGNTSKTS